MYKLPKMDKIRLCDVTEEGDSPNKNKGRWKFPLFSYVETPAFLKDNEYVFQGYRVKLTFRQCVKSLFTLHNETFNIWTHLVGGFVLFLCVFYAAFLDIRVDCKIILVLFLITALLVCASSAIFHAFGCMSARAYTALLKLDFCSISALIGGSILCLAFFGFYCSPLIRLLYTTGIIGVSSLGVIASCFRSFYTPKLRSFRAILFSAMGLSGIGPFVHLVIKSGWDTIASKGIALPIIMMAVVYLLGALVYAVRFPERFSPGTFDIFNSHTIFHVCVLGGITSHTVAVARLYEFATSSVC